MKIFITRYALTKGIMEMDGAEKLDDGMIRVRGDYTSYYHQGEWFNNFKDASFHADGMRKKKIKSLKNKLSKLEKMTFNEEDNDPT